MGNEIYKYNSIRTMGLKGSVATTKAIQKKAIAATIVSTKMLQYEKLVGEYKTKSLELNEIIKTTNRLYGKESKRNIGKAARERFNDLNIELKTLKEKVDISEKNVWKDIEANKLTDLNEKFMYLKKSTTAINDGISTSINSINNPSIKTEISTITKDIIKDYNSSSVEDLDNQETKKRLALFKKRQNNIEKFQAYDIANRERKTYDGREPNQQEKDAMIRMDMASLSPGAAKAREDDKNNGLSQRSQDMKNKIDADTLYKKWRQKGYSIEDAEDRASRGLTPIDDGPSHTKNWYKMQIQKLNEERVKEGLEALKNPYARKQSQRRNETKKKLKNKSTNSNPSNYVLESSGN